MPIRILVIDDQEVVRAGLRTLLAGSAVEIVAEASDREQALTKIKKQKLDLVILEVRLGTANGLDLLAEIQRERPQLPILVLSAFDSSTYVSRAAAAGATGYLLKSMSKEQLLDGIRRAAAGERVWARENWRRLSAATAAKRSKSDAEVALTKRESEVLQLLAKGATNKQIAKSLHISYETVKEHVQHILRKIGITDRTQAAIWAVRKGLA